MRLIAFAIDSLLAAIAVAIVKLPLSFMALAGVSALNANLIFQYSLMDVIKYVGVAAYFVLLTYYTHATPGKMLMKLQVVTEEDSWNFINILYRETIGRFLSGIFDIGYFAIMVHSKKQGFHDMLCNTYVVYRDMISENRENVSSENTSEKEPFEKDGEDSTIAEEQALPEGETESTSAREQVLPEGKMENVSAKQQVSSEGKMVSAFEMPESHPVETNVETENSQETESVD